MSNARSSTRQSGVAAVEFSLLAMVFFLVVFGAIEVARLMYMVNTLYDSTRRAAKEAALVSHRNEDELSRIRQRALFRNTPGLLPFGAPISDRNVRIDYLALVRVGNAAPVMTPIPSTSLPFCPRENRRICLLNPNASNCMRFVRVRICADVGTSACNQAPYTSIAPFIPMPNRLPRATTINVIESLGSLPEGTPCL